MLSEKEYAVSRHECTVGFIPTSNQELLAAVLSSGHFVWYVVFITFLDIASV